MGAKPDDLELLRFTVGPFEENVYLLIGPSGSRAALFDPGIGSEVVLATLESRTLSLEMIVNTHGHVDHAAGNGFFKRRTGAPLAIHPLDAPFLRGLEAQALAFGVQAEACPEPDLELRDGTPLRFDGLDLEVIHTPGHTPGGTCIRFGRRMIVGDTLFQGSVGRTDLPGGSWEELVASIRDKLFRLPGDIVCYPGHGPETTLADERRDNPFVSDAAVEQVLWRPR